MPSQTDIFMQIYHENFALLVVFVWIILCIIVFAYTYAMVNGKA